MTSRERVMIALEHAEPDRVPIDLGAMQSTSIMAVAYNNLKEYLGLTTGPTRMWDWWDQLADVEPEILQIIGADIVPLTVWEPPQQWKPWTLRNGSLCEVPASFNPETMPDGSQVVRDSSGRITMRMPQNGWYFDSVYHPLADVTSVAELAAYEPSPPPSEEFVAHLRRRARELYESTDYAIMFNGVDGIYEWAQELRGWGNFMMDLAGNQQLAAALLDKLVDERIQFIDRVLPAIDEYIQVVQTGDDLGLQDGPQLSPSVYRDIVKPRHARLYAAIKKRTSAPVFIHTCGSVREFIPDFIEMGIDVLNPVQVSAAGMDTAELKREFGSDIVFWGGGCDTQHVLPFGTPQEVRNEVKRRIADLAPGGGFVFTQVHNIQSDVPPENIMAMFDAAREFGTY